MKRNLMAALFAAMILTIAACSSSTPPESGEIRKLEGKRIPEGAGPNGDKAPPPQMN